MGAPSEGLVGKTAVAPVRPNELDAALAVLPNGLALPGLQAAVEPDGLLHLPLGQEFQPSGGGTQRIETEVRVVANW